MREKKIRKYSYKGERRGRSAYVALNFDLDLFK